MKKKLLCLFVAVIMLVSVLSGCSKEQDELTGTDKKPMTINLYGITGESTTEEAIKLVEQAMNEYTEGTFNTHIILHLYPEAEYYNVVEGKLKDIEQKKLEEEAEKKRLKDEAKARAKAGLATTASEETTEVETEEETYIKDGAVKVVYPAEKENQLDIFMVQGSSRLYDYYKNEWVASLNDALTTVAKKLPTYISSQLLSLATFGGTANLDGTVAKGTVYGIPNNAVYSGEYTYLLVNKEIAERNFYSEDDVDSLSGLQYFLMDAKAQNPEMITLYNAPTLEVQYITDEPCFVGGIVSQGNNAFTRSVPRDLLTVPAYRNFYQYLSDFESAGYIVEGDYHSEPEDGRKFAAAFLKGDSTLGEKYEDEYYVIKYLNPVATADECPGTMFCVSAYAANVERCMEIVTALETVSSFRDTFQYGVEGVNYSRDEYTGVVTYLNDTYSMNPADTGNAFIMSQNTSMDEHMLKVSANGWEQAKLELRETIFSPYAKFHFYYVTEDNYKEVSEAYKKMKNEAIEQAKAEAKENGEKFDEDSFVYDKAYPYAYTQEILDGIVSLSKEYQTLIDEFEEYTDEKGKLVTLNDYMKALRIELEKDARYLAYSSAKNVDSPYAQYSLWYAECGPSDDLLAG